MKVVEGNSKQVAPPKEPHPLLSNKDNALCNIDLKESTDMSAKLTSLVSAAIAKELPNAIKAAHVLLTDSAKKNALRTTEKKK